MTKLIDKIDWQKGSGLVPAVVQDARTNRVLMFAYMNKESLEKTIKTKRVWFYSRSKKRLWVKGEESKIYLDLVKIKVDCDADTLLVKVNPAGPTCHLLLESCFDAPQPEKDTNPEVDVGLVAELFGVVESRRQNMPENSYTTKLFRAGVDKMGAKVMEEAAEVYQAAAKSTKQHLVEESVDVVYHLLALLAYKEITFEELLLEIKNRRGLLPRELRAGK